MLLIDGVKYELWTPPSEDEFERVVKEHAQDIFGEQSIYLDTKQKLKSLSGIGSIPDGYVLILADKPYWYIVEVELSRHGVFAHIVPQVHRFTIGVRNPSSQKAIADAIFRSISKEEELWERVKSKVSSEIYKFLTSLISQQPKLAIIIDKETEELSEAVEVLKLGTRVIEFCTFMSKNDTSRRAYLFEPLKPDEPIPKDFLAELRHEVIKRRPEIRVGRPHKHYCSVAIGHKGIHLEWLFFHMLERKLGVELHLERPTRSENSQLLAKLQERRAQLERNIGEPLGFQPLWRRNWSRLYAVREIEWTSEFKEWAVETMIRFLDAFKPLLDEIDVV